MDKENSKGKKFLLPIIIFFTTIVLFILPSIIYIVKNKTIYRFFYVWTYFFRLPESQAEKLMNALIFFLLITILFLTYILIIKKHKQFSIKQIAIMIIIASILFVLVIPYTSSDVYSYIANGWSAAHYGENPYYISTGEITEETGQNEPMFNKVANCWRYETVVYGPLWTVICTALSGLSFGNIDIALLIFKLANLIVHLCNCIIIYKVTRKKIFVALYGLNPFILFEALANVHNDIFVILFILLAIYYTIKKKNLFIAVAFIALATAIKYLSILILPFIVIYYVRKKELKDRIKYCIICGLEYIAIIALFYFIFMKDLSVFGGIFTQQGKYNRSIFYILFEILGENTVKILQNICLGVFAIIFGYVCIKLLLQKNIKFKQVIKEYNFILLVFTFILITNFNPWYIMWFYPTMFWLRSKSQETILAISYSGEIANIFSFALWSEEAWLGIPYFTIMMIVAIIIKLLNEKIEIRKSNENN